MGRRSLGLPDYRIYFESHYVPINLCFDGGASRPIFDAIRLAQFGIASICNSSSTRVGLSRETCHQAHFSCPRGDLPIYPMGDPVALGGRRLQIQTARRRTGEFTM